MYVDAGLVDHRQVQGSPVLEEGRVDELVVDGEVVVPRLRIWGGWCGAPARPAYLRFQSVAYRSIECRLSWCGMGKAGEVQSAIVVQSDIDQASRNDDATHRSENWHRGSHWGGAVIA